MQKPGCVVYSFGSNGQVTFEEAVVNITHKHCQVHVFEFTLKLQCCAIVGLSAEQAHEVEAIEGVLFHGYGIGADDEIVNGRFQYENRVVNSYELKTLPAIMKELGHDWVHVFKMDIEGAEYEVLPSIMTHYAEAQQAVPVTQAQVEYRHWAGRPSTEHLHSTLWLVEEGGFSVFHFEFNYHATTIWRGMELH